MTGFAIPHRSPSGPFVEPTRRDRLDARLHAMALDRQLAAGVAPWTSPRHAARALQLTGRRERRALARGLNRSLQEARGAGLNGRLVAILIPCRSSVLACAGLLEQLSATLSGAAPLDAMSVARLRLILSDFDSALYVHGHAAQLREQVTQIGAQIAVDS